VRDAVARVSAGIVEVLYLQPRIGLGVELKEAPVHGVPVPVDRIRPEIALLEGQGEGEGGTDPEFFRTVQNHSSYGLGASESGKELQRALFGRGVAVIGSDGIPPLEALDETRYFLFSQGANLGEGAIYFGPDSLSGAGKK
jgi:hypothetical protein